MVRWCNVAKVADDEVKGTIDIPEFMHDTELDEIVFDIKTEKESKTALKVRQVIRKHMVPALRASFKDFNSELLQGIIISIQHMPRMCISQTRR